jgi:oligosaccharyl transferase complex subunit OST4
MISDDDLFRLAIFLGSCAMLLIVLYHFLEVNSKDDSLTSSSSPSDKKIPADADPLAFSPAAAVASRGKTT